MERIKHVIKNKPLKLLLASIIFWTPVIIFCKLAGDIIEKEPISFDVSILNFVHTFTSPINDVIFQSATNIAGATVIAFITVLLVIFFLYKNQRVNATILVAGMGGAVAANVILKLLFHRDRPSLWHPSVIETGFSFPSGHSMLSMALVLCIVLILWKTRYKWVAIISGALIVVVVGLSRLYLGVHYPSDVLAGWCVSTAWVLVVYFIIHEIRYRLHSKIQSKA